MLVPWKDKINELKRRFTVNHLTVLTSWMVNTKLLQQSLFPSILPACLPPWVIRPCSVLVTKAGLKGFNVVSFLRELKTKNQNIHNKETSEKWVCNKFDQSLPILFQTRSFCQYCFKKDCNITTELWRSIK